MQNPPLNSFVSGKINIKAMPQSLNNYWSFKKNRQPWDLVIIPTCNKHAHIHRFRDKIARSPIWAALPVIFKFSHSSTRHIHHDNLVSCAPDQDAPRVRLILASTLDARAGMSTYSLMLLSIDSGSIATCLNSYDLKKTIFFNISTKET